YYPFGMLMPGRKFDGGSGYRYGFNGQEKSDEIFDGSTTAEYWEYDSRIGRRWNLDPILKESESPYLCFSGSPIVLSDIDGDDAGNDGNDPDPPARGSTIKTDHQKGAVDAIAPNGDMVLVGNKNSKVHTVSTNLGTDTKADFRLTYFYIEGENGGWSWDNEHKAFMRRGIEFDNGIWFAIWNKVGMTTGTNLSEATTNVINGEPLKDTRQAYSQYKQNGGGGAVPGFIFTGLKGSVTNWWSDLNAGGSRSRDAWIGFWQFTSQSAKSSVFRTVSPTTKKLLPIQIHHFATNKNKIFTPQMAAIAKQFNLTLDGGWNKMALPHLGRHPNAYHIFVLKGMQSAAASAGGSQAQFIKLFNKYVIDPVVKNPQLLRKAGWQ
ncbi:AHH domain-containing protein, partial [Ferruginibacter sp. HRS2-29]